MTVYVLTTTGGGFVQILWSIEEVASYLGRSDIKVISNELRRRDSTILIPGYCITTVHSY